MRATVIRGFLRDNTELRPGESFECERNEYNKWLALGFVQGYETKIEPVKKKPVANTPSASAPPARPSKKKTSRRSRKKSTKSSG